MKNLKLVLFPVVTAMLLLTSCTEQKPDNVLDLSGEWAFQIDSADVGINEKWFTRTLNGTIILPGSMLTNNKGFEVQSKQKWTGGLWNVAWLKDDAYKPYREPGKVKTSFWLQPEKYFVSGIDNMSKAKQLLFRLKSYMASDAFNPKPELNIKQITNIYN